MDFLQTDRGVELGLGCNVGEDRVGKGSSDRGDSHSVAAALGLTGIEAHCNPRRSAAALNQGRIP